jgi:uncharacterized membrane protein
MIAPRIAEATIRHVWSVYLIVLIGLGIGLRFTALDRKPYWFNEVFTSMQMSGFDEHREVNPALYTGRPVPARALLAYQLPTPGKSAWDTVRVLATKDPIWPPLYPLMARQAATWFGPSVAAVRGLSAVAGALLLLAVYWLCRELGQSARVAGFAAGLCAVSPLFVRYSQEARAYMPWMLALSASSAALVRACREPTRGHWTLYAACLVTALYLTPHTLPLLAAHAAWLALLPPAVRRQAWRGFACSVGTSLLAFGPWLLVLLHRCSRVMATGAHLSREADWDFVTTMWSLHVCRVFTAWPESADATMKWLAVPVVAIGMAAAFATWQRGSPGLRWFLLLLAAVPMMLFVLPDLILGGQRSVHDRYFFPTCLAAIIAVSHWLAGLATSSRLPLRMAGGGLFVLLSMAGLAGSMASVRADTWWGLSTVDLQVAEILNRAPRPLLVTDAPYGVMAPLAYRLGPDVDFLLTRDPASLVIPDGYASVFLYQPSEALSAAIDSRSGITRTLVYRRPRWERTVYSLYSLEFPAHDHHAERVARQR